MITCILIIIDYVYSDVHCLILNMLRVVFLIGRNSATLKGRGKRNDVRLSKSWSLSILYKWLSFTNLSFVIMYSLLCTQSTTIQKCNLRTNECEFAGFFGCFFFWGGVKLFVLYFCLFFLSFFFFSKQTDQQ